MNPTYDFSGKVALVTGAKGGMGYATAEAFAKSGAAVVLADRDEAAVQEAAAKLTSAGYKAIGVGCDVVDEAQVDALVARTVSEFGRLDFAYNNAGIQGEPTDAADSIADDFDRVNAVNLRGIWACMKHELKQMREQGSGAIVNCSSLGGLVGLPGRAAYHASKHGVIGLTKSAALSPCVNLAASAPLLCAGITTFSPMQHWKLEAGQRVGIIGLGGLGHVATKLAAARKADVTIFTTSPRKVADAQRLGAREAVLWSDAAAMKRLTG